jgi:signal transduction histidine kinase
MKVFKSKLNVILLFFILLIIASALAEPIIKNKLEKNWNNDLVLKIKKNDDVIQNTFDNKNQTLVNLGNRIKTAVRSNLMGNYDNCFEELKNYLDRNISIQLNDEWKNRICWVGNLHFKSSFFDNKPLLFGQTFFYNQNLSTYLVVIDSLYAHNKFFYLCSSILIEEHFNYANDIYDQTSISDSLSNKLSTLVTIAYDREAEKSKDGRQYSSIIRNNFNNKIGIAIFDKPALDSSLKEIEENVRIFQSVCILIIFLLFGIIGFKSLRNVKNRFIKFFALICYLAVLRIFIFLVGVPAYFFRSPLTDPANFSSVFAYGIVKSPFELFLTLIFVLVIIYTINKYFQETFLKQSDKNWIKYFAALLFVIVLFFISYRAYCASIRSIVFDSTIRYFKDFTLFPSPVILLMDLNILLLGIISVLIAVILFKILLTQIPSEKLKLKKILWAANFLFFQLLGWIYDSLQKQPQGTPTLRIVFISIVFFLVYLVYFNRHKIIYYVYYGIAASILSVSLLVYYNSEIEREALKTTAQEITKYNEKIYEFLLRQTLEQFSTIKIPEHLKNHEVNYSAVAFKLWTESILYRENIPTEINIYDKFQNRLGSFSTQSYNQRSDNDKKINFKDESQFTVYENPFNSKLEYSGFCRYPGDGIEEKYVLVTLFFDKNGFNITQLPEFIIPQRTGIASATEFEQLKIFFFKDNQLISSIGGMSLDINNVNRVLNTKFSELNEAWLKLNINDEQYLFYLTKYGDRSSNIISVAIEEKLFAWNLSNFFKVFFIHSILLLIAFLFYALLHINKWKRFFAAYRTKLSLAFIIVSVIPLIFISFYIRSINEENNSSVINEQLISSVTQIENYFKNYSAKSVVSEKAIFEKASADLNLKFSIYDEEKLLFSSYQNFYDAGIFSKNLSAAIYSQSILSGIELLIGRELIDHSQYYYVSKLFEVDGNKRVIYINTLFNRVNIPLSNVELDLFIFGILSLVLALLIIFSTILAEQISSPVRKLTLATRSVGNGDLNIEIAIKGTGEVKELTDGFNMMVKKLHKSQIELAQLERETAWKEMAKQVAHEIKNPLTPMKLAVQQLIAAYEDKSNKFDEIFNKVTATVINQIETLKNIASEFSNFARMPNLTIQKANVVKLIKETLNLFSNEIISITFLSSNDDIYINTDIDQLNRTIINMIRNSIQANANNIEISINKRELHCEIRITDDGVGIEKSIVKKIFDENFTTKSQGMGLGLSMAKRFLESIDGSIEVESFEMNKTTFLIKIPLAV